APGAVADDGVGDVLEVSPDLMPSSGFRFEFEQCVAAGRIAVHAYRYRVGLEPAEVRDGCLQRALAARRAGFLVASDEWVVNGAGFCRVAAYDGQIALADLALFE